MINLLLEAAPQFSDFDDLTIFVVAVIGLFLFLSFLAPKMRHRRRIRRARTGFFRRPQ